MQPDQVIPTITVHIDHCHGRSTAGGIFQQVCSIRKAELGLYRDRNGKNCKDGNEK